jgi:predicted nucleotidyltransferase
MKIAGIIAEYNPFHNGHKYQIDMLKDMGFTHIVVCMSGNFVQRGEPAIFPKLKRAEMALSCGVDLVVELPTIWSMASADKFAFGGVSILNEIGINALCFGTECADIQKLKKTADVLDSQSFENELKNQLNKGVTYARARTLALEIVAPELSKTIEMPNNILAVEYIRQCKAINFTGEHVAISRIAVIHDDKKTNKQYASASLIRQHINDEKFIKDFLPEESFKIAQKCLNTNNYVSNVSNYERQIISYLRRLNRGDFAKYSESNELENRLYKAVNESTSLCEIYMKTKAKNFTHSSIRRSIMKAWLNIPNGLDLIPPPYIKILGSSKKGLEILSKISSEKPVFSNFSESKNLDENAKKVYNMELMCSNLYATCLKDIAVPNFELSTKFLKVGN